MGNEISYYYHAYTPEPEEPVDAAPTVATIAGATVAEIIEVSIIFIAIYIT